MSGPARPLDGRDLRLDEVVPAGQKSPSIDHHVDLIGAGVHSRRDLCQSGFEGCLATRKGGGNAGDLDRCVTEPFFGGSHHRGIDAHRGDRWNRGIEFPRERSQPSIAEAPNLLRCVGTFQSGQIDHRDRQSNSVGLGRGFDRASREFRRSTMHHHGIDCACSHIYRLLQIGIRNEGIADGDALVVNGFRRQTRSTAASCGEEPRKIGTIDEDELTCRRVVGVRNRVDEKTLVI